MEKKNVQKLNRAAVAAILATSGVTVTAPIVPTKAATLFADLNPQADYYEPVLELYNRGYIQGYEDGTFRPNNRVTRGHAAKMLAQALGLNTTSPTDPKFTDVPISNNYYPYIAALAQAGVISGYLDKTFRPNEPITRNQMAKIITLGYEFEQSTKLTNDFNDVSITNANKYYIQTLFDLGVTKGTTAITYSPSKPVTRGQLATFIMRAENVSAQSSKVKEIGDIIGNYVYINGSKHHIDLSLRHIFNEKNAAVLKGAHIEGQIAANTLRSVSKLTINAVGTKNNILVFDGQHSSFIGDVIIQGNYLQFKNWNVTGNVTISDAVPRTLSQFNSIAPIRVASLKKLAFIDWSKPTEPTSGGSLNGNNGSIDYPSKGDPSSGASPGGNQTNNKALDRMPVIDKYVDFTNCNLRRVTVDADRTYIAATTPIPHVTLTGDVRQFETYTDITTLYIETDVHTTLFGVSDIGTVYKNSNRDLYLNGDSYIGKLIIDSTNGWTDLGHHTYIDTVIIPPDTMPNDIFNDFLKDDDKIGNIEDPDGEEVDRDPIDDTIIPDYEAPILTKLDAKVDGNDAAFEIRSNEAGQYYYMIMKADERPPTIREILENNKSGTLQEGANDFYAYFDEVLEGETDYAIYAVVVDEAENVSDKKSITFKTRDGTAPVISNLTGEGLIGGTRARISFRPSEPGRYRYMVQLSSMDAPPLMDLMSRPEIEVTAEDVAKGVSFIHGGLTAQTQYTVYMVMTDLSGNVSAATDGGISYSAPFFTQALDNVPPRLTKTALDNTDITDIDREPTKVVLNFSEALDEATAQNVKNYTLGGTGNLKDNPYKATLSRDGKKVTLEIPSMAAFVNNDTLTIRIRNVEDVAGNKILDNLVNNMASYTYKANTKPILSNLFVNPTVTNPVLSEMPKDKADALKGSDDIDSNKVTFNTNYTGTYYYLIMPADPAVGVKKPLLSQVVFPRDNYEEEDLFQGNFALASGFGEAVVGDGATLERGNTFNIYYDPTEIEEDSDGYYIYMAVRDRNGNYSDVEVQYFLPTERDWELTSFKFADNPDDKTPVSAVKDFYYRKDYMKVDDEDHQFVFNMQFNASMDKDTVENELNYELTGDLAKYLEVKDVILEPGQTKATMTLGYKSYIEEKDIPVVGTYIAYYMRDKQKLDITMKGLRTWAMSETGKETTNTTTVKLNYVDQVKPRLLGQDPYSNGTASLAYRINENFTAATGAQIPAQLELTFSENVNLPTTSYADFAKLVPSLNSSLAINDIKYAKDEDNKNIENKLILSFTGNFADLERLKITLNETTGTGTSFLRDTANNTVMINQNDTSAYEAVYVYRKMPMEINYVQLDAENHSIAARYQGDGTYVYESKGLIVGLTGGYRYEGMTVHYMQATALSGNVTADMILNATSEISDAFGHQEIASLLQTIYFTAPYDTTQVFRNSTGTQIFIVLTDSYGNVSNVVKKQITIDPNDIPKP